MPAKAAEKAKPKVAKPKATKPKATKPEATKPKIRVVSAPAVDGASLYQVHDNGSRPFTVLVEEQTGGGARVRLYKTRQSKSPDWDGMDDCRADVYQKAPPTPAELLVTWERVARVWVARCPSLYADEAASLGNALLLELDPTAPAAQWSQKPGKPPTAARGKAGRKGASAGTPPGQFTYIHIGSTVYRFATADRIVEFDSPIGNNNVPYPAALSASEVFFLCEQWRMPRSAVKPPALAPGDRMRKKLSAEALRWVFIYDTLYEHPWQDYKRVAKPLEGYEPLIVP